MFIRDGYPDATAGFSQFWIQMKSVIVTIVWSGIASVIALLIAKKLCGGLRVSEDVEHTGLDLSDHGEEAYNSEN